jgi:hypothetical protein
MMITTIRWLKALIEADGKPVDLPGGFSLLLTGEQGVLPDNIAGVLQGTLGLKIRPFREDSGADPDLRVALGTHLRFHRRYQRFQIYLDDRYGEGANIVPPGSGYEMIFQALVGGEMGDELAFPSPRDLQGVPIVNADSSGSLQTVAAFQVATLAPTQINVALPATGMHVRERLVQNLGPDPIYLGGAAVTTATGLELPSGGGVVSVPGNFSLYAIAAVALQVSPADTRVLEIL